MLTTPLTADQNLLLFTDWGIPITLRQVSTSFNPQTGQRTESHVDTPLVAIISEVATSPTPDTAAQHPTHQQNFLLQEADLPTNLDFSTVRILHNNQEYSITSHTRSPITGLIFLSTQNAQ